MPIDKIAVLMTSFNRRESTLNSLTALFRQQSAKPLQFEVYLVNDGCTDGTDEAVRSRFPDVRVLQGDGTLFWNGGMRMAFEAGLHSCADAFLFLNDDTMLYSDGLERMADCATESLKVNKPAIVVGSTRSPFTGEHSYGGIIRRTRGLGLKLEKVRPDLKASTACDSMNGNIALIPREIANAVGNLDECFRHQFGDIDYGLRARRAGFDVVVAPGYIGECTPNSHAGTWRDPGMGLGQRCKHLFSPKGVPVTEWFRFTRRHYGWRWPYYAVSPYLRTIVSGLLPHKIAQHYRDATPADGDSAT